MRALRGILWLQNGVQNNQSYNFMGVLKFPKLAVDYIFEIEFNLYGIYVNIDFSTDIIQKIEAPNYSAVLTTQ